MRHPKLAAAVLAALSASACVSNTVADLRADAPFIETTTQKSVQEFAACLVHRWSSRSGQTNSAPTANGLALTLSYSTYQGTINAATVDIADIGSTRKVTVYARRGDAGDKLRDEVTGCF